MTTVVLRRRRESGPQDPSSVRVPWTRRRGCELVGLGVLVALSALVRLGGRGYSLWVDEGISVGIASHGLADIPALMSRDGSPPLYYVALHLWIGAFGSSEGSVRALSLLLALVAIPVAFWAAGSLFGRRSGWVAATLVAFCSSLTLASRDARMYPLLVVIALVAVWSFIQVLRRRRRAMIAVLALSLAALAYTHNWGLFLIAAMALAIPVCLGGAGRGQRVGVALDAAVAFGVAALVYAPWLPTLIGQTRHTGAPWSRTPGGGDILKSVHAVLGSPWISAILAGALVVALASRRQRSSGAGLDALILGGIAATTLGLAWLSSQFQPAWSSRYFATFLAPLLLVGAWALARAGRAGLLALAAVVALWTVPSVGSWTSPSEAPAKSNVRALAQELTPVLKAGDVVMASQFEQIPLFRYYLGPDLHYAEPSGWVGDPTVADWRDAMERMATADPAAVVEDIVDRIPPGAHVVLTCPRQFSDASDLLWYRLMDRNCEAAQSAMRRDRRMTKLGGPAPPPWSDEEGASMAVTLYQRSRSGP